MTRARLQSLVLQGFGQGRGENFKPWIRVTRGNAPRGGNQQVMVQAVHTRPLHLLSSLEYRAARLAVWLGPSEIREAFPLFPWSDHPHPMAGLSSARDRLLPRTIGLQEIAHGAGIDHGSYIGSGGLPFVATTDLLIRVGEPPDDRLVLWAVKPESELSHPKRGVRVRERIELERLYAKSIGAVHRVVTDVDVKCTLVDNLDWLEPSRGELHSASLKRDRGAFASAFNATDPTDAVENRIRQAAKVCDLAVADAQRYFRASLWVGQIDADLSQNVLMSRPLRTGGNLLKEELRAKFLGVGQ